MAKSSDTLDPEPVDAEFEPALDESGFAHSAKTSNKGMFLNPLLFLAAVALGGALGFAGMLVFQANQSPGDGLSAEMAAQTRVITGLETRLVALENEDPAQTARSAVSGLETRLTDLENQPAGSIDLSPIEARIEALETAPGQSGPVDDSVLNALTDRLAELETANADTQALALQAMEASSQTPPSAIDPQILENLSQRIFALETAEGRVEPDAAQASQLAALQTRLDELETALSQARNVADSAQQTADTTAETMANRPADTGDAARQLAARALALTALRDMAASGDAFEAERAALARLWRGNEDLAALASYSRAGVPTIDDLSEMFPGNAIREASGSGKIFFGLIEVRRIGAEEGDADPLAVTALVEDRLREDDLEGAVALTERFEGASMEEAQSWLLAASARLNVDSHIGNLRQVLMQDAADQGADPS